MDCTVIKSASLHDRCHIKITDHGTYGLCPQVILQNERLPREVADSSEVHPRYRIVPTFPFLIHQLMLYTLTHSTGWTVLSTSREEPLFWRFHRNRWVVTFSMDTDGWIIYPSYYILLLRYEIQRAMKLKWFQNTLTCYLPNRLKPGYMLSLKHLSELAETPSKRFPTFHSGRTMWRQIAKKMRKITTISTYKTR